jgi:hypothetical protein
MAFCEMFTLLKFITPQFFRSLCVIFYESIVNTSFVYS